MQQLSFTPAKLACFELVFHTFAKTPSNWEMAESEAYARLAREFQRMSMHYHHNVSLGAPEYAGEVARHAYTCKYVPAHAHWLFTTLKACPVSQVLFKQTHLKVVVLGGGPGAEMLGLVKFLVESNRTTSISCDVYDRCTAWEDNWQMMQGALRQRGHLEERKWRVRYHAQNFHRELSEACRSRIGEADLVLSSFLLSEMRSQESSMMKFLERVFGSCKPGAMVVINDNLKGQALARLDASAETCGMAKQFERSRATNVYPMEEVESSYAAFWKRLAHSPKCKGELGERVYTKSLQTGATSPSSGQR
ncbi:MAG: hypothetical protein VKP62_13165 [Candidatus Sericytochromatia bacterium]|nr:hypothetical protein [Candidatus Sericytochromatia bacterium]